MLESNITGLNSVALCSVTCCKKVNFLLYPKTGNTDGCVDYILLFINEMLSERLWTF